MAKSKLILKRRSSDLTDLLLSFVFFLLTAIFVHEIPLSSAEIGVFYFINKLPIEIGPILAYFMMFGSYLGAISFIVVSILKRSKSLTIQLITGSVLVLGTIEFFKTIVDRVRPNGFLQDLIIRETKFVDLGFPSGHTATATMLASITVAFVPKKYHKYLWTFAILMGLARIYAGVHFPIDIVGGFILGLCVSYLVRIIYGVPSDLNKKNKKT